MASAKKGGLCGDTRVGVGGSSAAGSRIVLCEVSEDDGFARSSVATEL